MMVTGMIENDFYTTNLRTKITDRDNLILELKNKIVELEKTIEIQTKLIEASSSHAVG